MKKSTKIKLVKGGVVACAALYVVSLVTPADAAPEGKHYKEDAHQAPTTTVVSKTTGESLSKHMKDIRFCESTDNYTAVNKQSPSHTGAFQFADSTWAGYKTGYKHAKDAPKSVQDKIAMQEYAKNGNSPWLASKPCWKNR